jgi:hypothetical protein
VEKSGVKEESITQDGNQEMLVITSIWEIEFKIKSPPNPEILSTKVKGKKMFYY